MSETEFKERKYQEKRNGNHSNGEKNFSNEKKNFHGKPFVKKHTNSPTFQKYQSTTIVIKKVFFKDLSEESKISEMLISQRVKYLKDALETFGKIEGFLDNVLKEHTAVVTYEKREQAEAALKTLRNKEKTEELIQHIHDELQKSKLPLTICPQFSKYKYEWSDRKAEKTNTVKTAYSQNKVTTVVEKKEVVEEKKRKGSKKKTKTKRRKKKKKM